MQSLLAIRTDSPGHPLAPFAGAAAALAMVVAVWAGTTFGSPVIVAHGAAQPPPAAAPGTPGTPGT